jgi:predicted DNA-binding transcriptional regulator AlpA
MDMPQKEALASPAEVGEYLGLPVATLAQWRYLGKGPQPIKVGRHIRYRWADVEAWLDRQQAGSDPRGT